MSENELKWRPPNRWLLVVFHRSISQFSLHMLFFLSFICFFLEPAKAHSGSTTLIFFERKCFVEEHCTHSPVSCFVLFFVCFVFRNQMQRTGAHCQVWFTHSKRGGNRICDSHRAGFPRLKTNWTFVYTIAGKKLTKGWSTLRTTKTSTNGSGSHLSAVPIIKRSEKVETTKIVLTGESCMALKGFSSPRLRSLQADFVSFRFDVTARNICLILCFQDENPL